MAQPAAPKIVIIYADKTGVEPFTKWLQGLRDVQARRRILIRLRRVEQGNDGDHRFLGDGGYELRLTFGPGYRVSFGEDGDTVVVILLGGDKSSQEKDIEQAKAYWKEYQSHDEIPHTGRCGGRLLSQSPGRNRPLFERHL